MNNNSNPLLYSSDLIKRVLFLLFALSIYRFGGFITLPAVSSSYVMKLFENTFSSGLLGMFNLFSGGALSRMTIFALNVMPYIVSSIIVQIFVTSLKNDGKIDADVSSQKISFYSKVFAIFLAFIQASVIVFSLQKMGGFSNSDAMRSALLKYLSIVTLVGGTLFLVWLGGQITAKGIGNGMSMIIFAGIVAELPSSFSGLFSMVAFSGGIFKVSTIFILLTLLVLLIVLFERSYRNIPVSYPRRQHGNRFYKDASSHIPVKLNVSGVIPPIFANAIILFPLTIADLIKGSYIGDLIIKYISFGQPLYFVLYAGLIVFFCFFYSDFVFNTKELSESLKKNGSIVAGKRPGLMTKKYLDYVLVRITVVGAAYLATVCIIPELVKSYFGLGFAIGGTSLLIIVSVVIEFLSQVQVHAFSARYSDLSKKNGFIYLNH